MNWVGNLRIAQKYLLAVVIILLSVMVSGLYSYTQYRSMNLADQLISVEKDFTQAYEQLSEMGTRLLHMTTLFQSNETVNDILSSDPSTTPISRQLIDQKPIVQLLKTMEDGTEQYVCKLFLDDNLIMSERGDMLYPIGEYEGEQWLQMALNGWGWTFFATPRQLENADTLSIVRPIRSLTDYTNLLAVLRMDIPLAVIRRQLTQSAASGVYAYLEAPGGEIIATSEEAPASPRLLTDFVEKPAAGLEALRMNQYDDSSYRVCYRELPDSGWRLVAIADKQALISEIAPQYILFAVTACVFILIGLMLVSPVISLISRRIRVFYQHTEMVPSEALAERLAVSYHDEIGQLMESHNHMLDRIDALIEQSKRREEEQRRLELAALQSQINPHFLYNTLEMIAWMAQMNMPERVREIIQSLTRFYKLSLSSGNDVIPLKAELQMVSSYMRIQRHRFDERVELTIDVDEGLMDFMIPKITLQPIVENALLHGVLEKPDKSGRIWIEGRLEPDGGHAVIAVIDDGVGISPLRWAEYIRTDRSGGSNSYGLYNVERRLGLYYGLERVLTLDQSEESRTRIWMRLPVSV